MTSVILIILGAVLIILGFLGVIRTRSIKWAALPLWRAVLEMIIGIAVLVIGFMKL
jgi:NAD/NADP transhydrogenase beta subunit